MYDGVKGYNLFRVRAAAVRANKSSLTKRQLERLQEIEKRSKRHSLTGDWQEFVLRVSELGREAGIPI